MATFAVDAIVLTRKDIGEADRLITIFSRTMGKQRVIAKGARRTTSHMAAHLEPGRESHLFLVERRSLPLVTQATTTRMFISGRADLAELKDLFSVLEITASLLDDNQRDSRFYDLVTTTLTQLNLTTDRPKLVASFMLKALHMLGYSIELTQCVSCSKALETEGAAADPAKADERFILSAMRGGVLHATCAIPGPGTHLLSANALNTMRQLLAAKLDTINGLTNSVPGAELTRPITAFVEWTSERTFKSSLL